MQEYTGRTMNMPSVRQKISESDCSKRSFLTFIFIVPDKSTGRF